MKKILLLTLFVIALAAPMLAQDYKSYSFPLGYHVSVLNASGTVAGIGNGQVFLWTRAGGFQYLGNLGGGTSSIASINNSGAIVGKSIFADGTIHAFLWTQQGGMQDLGSPLGGESDGFAINDAGQATGVSYSPDHGTAHAFFWSQATGAVDIGTLGSDSSSFYPLLNNPGEVAGVLYPSQTVFRWTVSTGIQALPSLGGGHSEQSAINDSGQIAGDSSNSAGKHDAALWAPDGSIQDLGVLSGDDESLGMQMNSAGHVAGYSFSHNGNSVITRIFLWTPGTGMVDVGAGACRNVGLFALFGLNNRDQILGQTCPSPGHPSFTFLWSPTLGLHNIGATLHPLVEGGGSVTFNDAGQFLAQHGEQAKLFSPILHVSLSSSQNPSVLGGSVTFTAMVSAIVGIPPDGEQVSFYDGRGRFIGAGTLTNGSATFTTSTLETGMHYIFAQYAGDSNYDVSGLAKLIQVVNP